MTLDYNGNQLKNVTDAVDQSTVVTSNDFVDKGPATDAGYLYDANGNQTADLNKGIALIHYNLLNLPQKVQFQNGTKNEYLYDASGVKHRAGYNYSTVTSPIPLGNTDPTKENNATSTFQTDYCSYYVYEKSGTGNPILRRILTPEGYFQTYGLTPVSTMGNWTDTYLLKDHLGNTRMILYSANLSDNTSKEYSATDQIDYYPFGMERSLAGQTSHGLFNSGTNPYLYSGKEVDRMNGLNENDFSARWLDNAVPGFTSSDPLAERHPDESPYLYCGNNPVNRVDPSGLEWYTKEGGSSTDYYFLDNISTRPTYKSSDGQNYNYKGKTVSYCVGVSNDGKFSTIKVGDENGLWSTEIDAMLENTTTTAINLSLALYGNSGGSIGGNCNNIAPDRSGGNSGQNSSSGMTSGASFLLGTTNVLATKLLINEYKSGADVLEIMKGLKTVSKLGKASLILDAANVVGDVVTGNVQSSTVTDVAMIGIGIIVGVSVGPIAAGIVGGIYGASMIMGGQNAINDAFNGDWNATINNSINSLYKKF